MTDANWWLMALAFALGVALTLASMVRRVTSEGPASVPHDGAMGFAGGRSGAESEKEPDDGE